MFESIQYWHWLVGGFLLLILEMIAPGVFLMWFGFGAMLVGGLLWIFPEMSWQMQFFLFTLFSVISIAGWRAWRKGHPEDDTESGVLNQRGKALIGRQVALVSAIKNGVGRVQIDDTFWRVEGPDLPKGALVKVTGADGATLEVEPVESAP